LGVPPLVRVEERPGTEAPGEEEHEESQPTEARERAGKGLVDACGLHPQRVTREGSSLSCAADERGARPYTGDPRGGKAKSASGRTGPIGAASFPQACRSPA